MSVYNRVFDHLTRQNDFISLLAVWDYPSIYEVFAPQDAPLPFVTYDIQEAGTGEARTDGSLSFEIFCDSDTKKAEHIKDSLIKHLDRFILVKTTENENDLYLKYDRDFLLHEDEEGFTHWHVEFSFFYWR